VRVTTPATARTSSTGMLIVELLNLFFIPSLFAASSASFTFRYFTAQVFVSILAPFYFS
jgi:hypothetical protein